MIQYRQVRQLEGENMAYQDEGEQCRSCGARAKHRVCETCGESGWVIDCGHFPQPRPISADSYGHAQCDDCADNSAATLCPGCGKENKLADGYTEEAPREYHAECWL